MKVKKALRSIGQILHRTASFVFDHSGARWIVSKFKFRKSNAPKLKEPPSGFLWIVGVYIAIYGLATQNYERAISTESIIASNWRPRIAETGVNEYCSAMREYKAIVAKVPVQPALFDPIATVRSLFGRNVISMSQTNFRARELERIAYHVAQLSGLRTHPHKDGFAKFPLVESAEDLEYWTSRDKPFTRPLLLDTPFTRQILSNSDVDGPEVYHETEPEPPLFQVERAWVWGFCFGALEPDFLPENTHERQHRYDCASVVFSRACEETRVNIGDVLFDKDASTIDAGIIPEYLKPESGAGNVD